MSKLEGAFCRSAPWQWFARRAFLPWAAGSEELSGPVLELGSGGGAMAEAADATALGYADGEFGTVVSFMMLHHVGAWEPSTGFTPAERRGCYFD